MSSREKIPPGSDSPRRPTRSNLRKFIASAVGRLRNSPGRIFQRLGTQTESATESSSILLAAVKSPLGAQTVLGDRHDLIYEILLQVPSAACGTRPAEFFNGWIRKQMCDRSEKRSSENLIRQRGQRNDLNPGEFASRARVRVGEAQHV